MTKLTDNDIRQIIADNFADDSCTSDDIAFARAIEDAVLERAAQVCDDRHYNWRFGDGEDSVSGPKECAELIRAMRLHRRANAGSNRLICRPYPPA